MEIIAHRGASYDAPENTLAAVRLAWEQKADAVEVDIHLSSDGKLVVIHDARTRRTGGVNKRVGNQTLQELRRLDFGKWKGRHWSGQTIPTLDEVIATVPNGRRLLVEFKCGSEAIAEFVAVFRRSGKTPEQIVPIGFALPAMKMVKVALPRLEVYWATQFKRRGLTRRWLPTVEDLIDQTLQAGLDGFDIRASGPINAELVRQVKKAGLRLVVWTVNSAARARRLAGAGVDGITTDRPGWLRTRLEL